MSVAYPLAGGAGVGIKQGVVGIFDGADIGADVFQRCSGRDLIHGDKLIAIGADLLPDCTGHAVRRFGFPAGSLICIIL